MILLSILFIITFNFFDFRAFATKTSRTTEPMVS